MGDVTCVFLSIGWDEAPDIIKLVNKFWDDEFKEENDARCFKEKDLCEFYEAYGGTKAFQNTVYPGAFNHLDLHGFMQHLDSIKWENPELIQVMYMTERQDLWKIDTLESWKGKLDADKSSDS